MIWHCRPTRIVCPHGHVQLPLSARIRVGHVDIVCAKCSPTWYAFGVVAQAPTPLVTLYPITEAQMAAYRELHDDMTTLELLAFFGYHNRKAV